jgi:hypothetical protein
VFDAGVIESLADAWAASDAGLPRRCDLTTIGGLERTSLIGFREGPARA